MKAVVLILSLIVIMGVLGGIFVFQKTPVALNQTVTQTSTSFSFSSSTVTSTSFLTYTQVTTMCYTQVINNGHTTIITCYSPTQTVQNAISVQSIESTSSTQTLLVTRTTSSTSLEPLYSTAGLGFVTFIFLLLCVTLVCGAVIYFETRKSNEQTRVF